MRLILATAAFLLALSPVAMAETTMTPAPVFTPEQRAEVESIIRQFLVEKEPETIAKAYEVLQQRQSAQQMEITKEGIKTHAQRIFNDKNSPVLGNPKGDVTIVEFYDYSCGYCKLAQAEVKKLLEQDKNVRFIAKEYPILGEPSAIASRAALASVKQGKFETLHNMLFSFSGQMGEAVIMDIAERAGLDTTQLKKDMNSKDIDNMISENRKLGAELGVRGTPMFIIGDSVHPGALKLEAMQKAVADARTANKK